MKTKSKFKTHFYLLVALALAGVGGQAAAQIDSTNMRGTFRANTVRPEVPQGSASGTLCGSGRGNNGVMDQLLNYCQGYSLQPTPAGWINVPYSHGGVSVEVTCSGGGGPSNKISSTVPSRKTSSTVMQAAGDEPADPLPCYNTFPAASYVLSLLPQDRNLDGGLGRYNYGGGPLPFALPIGYFDALRSTLSTSASNYSPGRAACPPGYLLNLIAAGPDGETYSCVKQ